VDLNNDGYMDVVSGRHDPNDITWFKGSKKGFQKGIIIKEEKLKLNENDMSQYKSTPCFIDIDGDKDLDLFVATSTLVYFNRNIGTPENPKFGKRELLMTTQGKPIGNSSNPTIAVVDWDNDNILDIVISDGYGYTENKKAGLSYYKGLGNGEFEPDIPITKNEKNKRYIPGCAYWICSTDWNNDGKPDILVGTSLLFKKANPIDKINNNLKPFYNQSIDMKEVQKMEMYGCVYLLLGK
jgi:hypothetical protein